MLIPSTRRAVALMSAAVALTAAVVVPALVAADPGVTAPSAGLGDGRHFGRIADAYVAPEELVFDAMTMDRGRDADEGDDLQIRDVEPGPTPLSVDGSVTVTRVHCAAAGCVEGHAGDYSVMTRDAGPGSYWWITVADGVVVHIDEQYVA